MGGGRETGIRAAENCGGPAASTASERFALRKSAADENRRERCAYGRGARGTDAGAAFDERGHTFRWRISEGADRVRAAGESECAAVRRADVEPGRAHRGARLRIAA